MQDGNMYPGSEIGIILEQKQKKVTALKYIQIMPQS